ncbi:AraC family ligand binding domain-containing protein [Methanosarcina sp. T3]|uniref:AraC family ligand binding domain-containing protein n=1 Tax=Methanosarcina sp. T3 TaxID=3439062 RepID=UPI003F86C637
MKKLTVLDSIENSPGVETLEGKIGPLISGNKGSAHYIVMYPDQYCEPHTHPTESIIYTAKGEWVLNSGGKRYHMKEGSLFFMPPNIETGYEVPFANPATLLIIKFEGESYPEEFLKYLEGLKCRLSENEQKGEIFKISALPMNHPARLFPEKVKLIEK